jgi:hypothetical protein
MLHLTVSPPSPGRFAATLSRREERVRQSQRARPAPLSPPYPLADMASLSGRLAKASLRGRGVGGEGGFNQLRRSLFRDAKIARAGAL